MLTQDPQPLGANQHRSLQAITKALSRNFARIPPTGYIPGRTRIRDAVISLCSCSSVRAEVLVEQLLTHGFIHYDGNPRAGDGGMSPWRFSVAPRSVS